MKYKYNEKKISTILALDGQTVPELGRAVGGVVIVPDEDWKIAPYWSTSISSHCFHVFQRLLR